MKGLVSIVLSFYLAACGNSGSRTTDNSAINAGAGGQSAAGQPLASTGAGGVSSVSSAIGTGGIGAVGDKGGRGGTGGTVGTIAASGAGGGGKGGAAGISSAAGANAGASAGSAASAGCAVAAGSVIGVFTDPVKAADISPPDPPGIAFKDTEGNPVNAHGGGVIRVCDTFYLHGEYFLNTTTDNNFNGFSMYSSKDLATWKNEGIILPQQSSGLLGPNRKGERPHIIKCPGTGEFVLYAHAADSTYQADKEVVYATSTSVNGKYAFKGALTNSAGKTAAHSDMSALTDGDNAYVITESGWVYTLSEDCHSWVSSKQYSAVNGTSGGIESPTVFKAGSTYYWIGSSKTGWRANDNFYSTAPAITGPWTYQGYLAPVGKRTWMSQSTWVIEVSGTQDATYVYWGDHWYGNQDTAEPGKHNYLATYVFQPLVFDGTAISLPTYQVSWKLDIGAGTVLKN